jgi:1-aminocyclopropane-1-carboxylate deaminase/D-cysteine desulfhydrase-like pyridoxal-dependent ACC family enzyme
MLSFLSTYTKHKIFNKTLFIKRDDIVIKNGLSGNKMRKLKNLNKLCHHNSFKFISSYGGFQSNAMAAIASNLYSNNINTPFIYFTNKIPNYLVESPFGNYKTALDLGTNVNSINDLHLTRSTNFFHLDSSGIERRLFVLMLTSKGFIFISKSLY